jgi:ribonuclease HI
MVEYEALVLGLKDLKKMGSKRIYVHGDSELIINQVKGIYQAKHPGLRAYRNTILDLLEEFLEYILSTIPRDHNQLQFSKFQSFLERDMRLRSSTDQQCLIILSIDRFLKMINK